MFLTMSSDAVCMIASELSSSLFFKICKGEFVCGDQNKYLRQNVMFSHREAAT